MRNGNESYTSTRVLVTIKNIGLGIAHHTRITVTTGYKNDDGYPAFDIVMPPNSEKSTMVQFNVKEYDGDLGRKEDIFVNIRYDDVLGNTYKQEARCVMVVRQDGAELMQAIDMKGPQLYNTCAKVL